LGPTGTRLADLGGSSSWGALSGMDAGTDWVPDAGRYALDFDGTNDLVTATVPVNSSRFSVSCWVKMRSHATRQGIFSYGVSSAGIYVDVLTTGFVRAAIESSPTAFIFRDSSTALSIDSLRHVFVTYSRENVNVFVDGRNVTTGGGTSGTVAAISPSALSISNGFIAPYGGFCNCLNFETVLWDRTVSANEIWQLYQIGRGGMLTPAPSPALFAFPSNPLAIFAASHAAVVGG